MKESKHTRRRQKRSGKFLISTIFMVLLVTVSVSGMGLQKRYNEYLKKESALEAQIEEEKKRTEDIEEFGKYAQTKKYIEEIARDKLGLVYEDEITFKAE